MEDYTVQQKNDGPVFYVLRMPDNDSGTIILANVETGALTLVRGIEALAQNFEFDSLVDDLDDEEDDEPEPGSTL